eukprot:CAMPEP_0178896004 /NCGR_PEP_ID=MMETSP0786-20121207/905_1 /TAXON_ID=186022 /ORGANISM="Thalassionema frauenfeldii, Strain CCMP 1798" /LENGTH=207 /DNA_ID=CAMNT_0020566305 /DNA_START=381 /DNA_END=1007 /DNA_ORIENTATION=-
MAPHTVHVLDSSFEPHPDDILLGRKANAFNHPGNQRYRHLITQNLRQYAKCKSRLDKGIVTEQVTKEILDGGRVKFLRLCEKEEIWKEVAYRTIQGKVAHALRDGVTKMSPFPDDDTEEKSPGKSSDACNGPELRNLSSTILQAELRRRENLVLDAFLQKASKPRQLSSEMFTLATRLRAVEELTAKNAYLEVWKRQQEMRVRHNNN